MARATLATLAAAAVLVASGCGGEEREPTRVPGDRLTIYASLPADGPNAAAGRAAELGMRRALADADGRAGGRSVRLVALPATEPGDMAWDPAVVEANAERAAEDRTTIAYLGELGQGATAVSLPVTNRAGILQVSPADGLTSLTRTPPGRPRAGPERYYPEERSTFVRLVPPDVLAARAIVSALEREGARRVVILHGDRISDRELEGAVVALLDGRRERAIESVRLDDGHVEPQATVEAVADAAGEVVEARPDAIVYAGSAGPLAERMLAELEGRLPGVPVIGSPQLADGTGDGPVAPAGDGGGACALTGVPVRSRLPRPGRGMLAALGREAGGPVPVEALLGYDAMALTLAAVDAAGPDRAAVVRAAKGAELEGRAGTVAIGRRGDPVGRALECVEIP